MKPLSVEDGITDEQAVKQVYHDMVITDARSNLPLRSATPEELTAQRESLGANYKPGPRQATPFMPERIGDHINCPKHGLKFGFCEECVESPEELPPLTFRRNTCDTTLSGHMVISRGDEAPYAYTCAGVEQEICDAVNAYRKPTLPVPERTTLPTREAVETALGIHDYPAKTIKWHLALLTEGERRILFRAVIEAAQPVPERTAEMEQLLREIHGEHDRNSAYGRCACWACIRIDALDHIEGKPKLPIQEVKE